MVVEHVEDGFEASDMERLDHLLELNDLLAQRATACIAYVRGQSSQPNYSPNSLERAWLNPSPTRPCSTRQGHGKGSALTRHTVYRNTSIVRRHDLSHQI